MGNKFTLTIKLDHGNDGDRAIVAGTSLKGKVVLTVQRKIDPANLCLRLLGKENTIISRATKSTRDEKIIARAVTQLRESGHRKISRGVYTIPFEFALPASLPSSTQFPKADTRAFNGRLKYTLQARLGDFHYERDFLVVSAPLPADIVPCIAQPTTHELRSLGFLNKGFLSVGASVENSYVGRGQTLRVSIASRNDTSVDIGRVRVKLMELIEYKAQEEKETSKVELQKLKDIDHLPGLVKAHSPVGDVRRNILQGLGRSMEATYQSIFEDLVSGENQFDLVVPTHSRDSYNGNLITISHYLKITFITKALVENPSTKIPIVIGNPGNNPELQTSQATRRPNEPIATVIIDEEIPTQEERDDIDIVVGSRAEEFPMATAVLLNHQNSNRQSREHPTSTAPLFPYDEKHDEFNYDSNEPPSMLPPPVVPSAPPESLLRQVDNNVTDDASFESEVHNYLPSSFVAPHHAHSLPHQQSSYPPNDLYNTHPMRQRVESYTYDDTSVEESMRHRVDDSFSTCYTQDTGNEESSLHHYGGNQSESQHLRHPDEKWMLNRLIQELRGSIHDYEVVASKVGNFHYREIFKTLTAKEFGSLIAAISMSHQVKVALLLAKKNNRFMCEHCASAISKTSEYFRSNMAETLLPHCRDLGTNRHLVEDELNEWEQIVTNRSFEDCVRRRRRWV